MKVLLITHKSDIDGATPVILSKIVFGEIDYILLEASESNSTILSLIENQTFDKYDNVFVTDLTINSDICEKIDGNEILREKIKIFDHHNSNLFVNDFDFGTVIDIDEQGNKQSGTSLFYKYLIKFYDNENLKKNSVRDFVELVRQYDTWEWFEKYNNQNAKFLSDIFGIFGVDYFIKYYYDFLKEQDNFKFSDKEKYLLDIEQEKINKYIEKKSEQITPIKLLGHNIGVVFAENYRSELGNSLARKFEDKYDFMIIINIGRGISYRGCKNIDLGKFASLYGGKGHVNASGSPLPSDLTENVIKMILGDEVIINELEK